MADFSSLALPHVVKLHAYTPGLQPTESGWVKLNTNSLTWEVLQRVSGNGGNAVNVALSGSGAYALVVPDAGEDLYRLR